ncbi:hypothetical protein HNV10_12905 [Winogradskyella litoriviva]|uniref:Lipoprotein n=1 Tax=Winogradskyella litoriviva TaxID=1220182 RepID=A0ABX2E755_9FLAO|nr:hypothetical protein [Winogradskyella litoriviva]NRD24152.1 hypothetical protein [Winogradskyella litoriviva]
MRKRLLLSILTLGLLGCEHENQKNSNLTNLETVDGFVDVPLTILETKELDEYFEYNTGAMVNKDTIGLIVRLKKNIPAGFVNGQPKNMFLSEGIQFVSKGKESDDLLSFLSYKYGLNNSNLKLKDSQTFTCANLNQEKTNYNIGESRFKIFLEGEEDYSELYVNFNFSKGVVYLNEKDEEYRAPLIKLLKK